MATDDITEETLRTLYLGQKVPIKQIAREFHKSQATVRRQLHEYCIPIRTKTDVAKILWLRPSKEELEKLYWGMERSTPEIARKFNVTARTVLTWMAKYEMPRRTLSGACALRQMPSGDKSHSWKGGRRESHGYIHIYQRGHPRVNCHGYVQEHILVWEQVHGKPLPGGWVVHHLNGVRNDNRPENLVGMSRGQHAGLAGPYKKRIRELEAKVKLLERSLDNQQLIWWSEN